MDESDFWKNNERTIFGAVKGLYAPGWTIDDLINEARVGIWEAHLSWRPEGGRSWRTYSFMIARRRVMDLVTFSLRKKHEHVRTSTELEISGAYNIPEFMEVGNPQSKEVVRKMLDQVNMTDHQKSVMDILLKDKSYTEAAHELGITYRSVDNAYQTVLRKLKRLSNPDT